MKFADCKKKKIEVGGNLLEKVFGESTGENATEESPNTSHGDEYRNISVTKSKPYLAHIVHHC